VKEIFDNIANRIEKLGFEIIRNPLPLVYLDVTRRKERLWYFAAANTTLVQMSNDKGKIVWLPTYGHGQWKSLSSTYKANSEIWQNLGFEGETFTHLQKTWVLFTTLKIFETW
jgi:hypothetical protein